MAQTLDDIPVTSDAWVDISTISGITAGVKYTIQNKGITWVDLYEGTTTPAIDESSGNYLAEFPLQTSIATIKLGSLKIWAKARPTPAYKKTMLNVQEV